MTALIVAEAVAVALLGMLVAGLLRSHADILRRLHALGAGDEEAGPAAGPGGFRVEPGLAEPRDDFPSASDLVGVTPGGQGADEAIVAAVVGTAHDTLIGFLSSGCLTCRTFWEEVGSGRPLGLPAGTRLVLVTKGPEDESVSAVADLAPAELPVVMSSQAWEAYGVPGSPYFVYVHGRSGRVIGEGAATRWEQVVDLLTQAIDDIGHDAGHHDGHAATVRLEDGRAGSGLERADRVDRALAAAGIHPGHPSLYPASGQDVGERPTEATGATDG
jgi:hypothetical protein